MTEEGRRIMPPLPPHHVYPFVIGILLPLALGLTLVLPHSRGRRRGARRGEPAPSLDSPLEDPEGVLSRDQRRWLEPIGPANAVWPSCSKAPGA
jgi:hypothetical protein